MGFRSNVGKKFILEYEFRGDKIYNSLRRDLVEVCITNGTFQYLSKQK